MKIKILTSLNFSFFCKFTIIFIIFYILKNFDVYEFEKCIINDFCSLVCDYEIIGDKDTLFCDAHKEPLDIFCVVYDYNISLIFNNISLQMFFDFFLFIFIFKILYFNVDNFKNYNFYFLNNLYFFIWNLFKNLVLNIRLERFFFVIFSYLLCIVMFNLGGFSFYEISFTSHISLTIFLSFSIFINFIFNMFINFNEITFLKFIQKTNIVLIPFLFVIEIVSFLVRPLSLSIRLFANIMSGHILMHMFLSAFVFFYKSVFWLSVVIFIFCVFIFFMELFVSIIQAYIFVVLLLVYSKDSVDIH